MPIEVDYQYEIVKAVKDQDGFGIKLSNRFLIGVPDLYLKPLGMPSMLVEVKLLKGYPVNDSTQMEVALSALQRRELLNHQEAGGVSGWLLVVQVKTGIVDMLAWPVIDKRFRKGEFQELCSQKTPQTGWWKPLAMQLRNLSLPTS